MHEIFENSIMIFFNANIRTYEIWIHEFFFKKMHL